MHNFQGNPIKFLDSNIQIGFPSDIIRITHCLFDPYLKQLSLFNLFFSMIRINYPHKGPRFVKLIWIVAFFPEMIQFSWRFFEFS